MMIDMNLRNWVDTWTDICIGANAIYDRNIALVNVQSNGFALDRVSNKLRADREVVATAVKKNGLALFYAPDIKADREIVLEAVKNTGQALEFASKELKEDKEIVLAAVLQDGHAFYHSENNIKADRYIVLAAVQKCEYALMDASSNMKNDFDIVFASVKYLRRIDNAGSLVL
jgi:hypothetical protein